LTRGEGTVDAPQKFTGKRLDDSTGLYYFGARYYDPQLGRFIQPDTIVQAPSDPQTLNRYTYARNNPLIYTDPTGHFSWKKFWKAAVGAFVGVVAAVLLGPAGFALMGYTMAGIIGGAVGGAITGGLNGGWKGALIGGALGGALGGIGAWGVSTYGAGFGLGMLAVGAGVAGATNSWDSFAGGLVGGLAGAFAGQGIISANSQQFANFRAGNGFVSNRTLNFRRFEEGMQTRHALNVNQADTPAQLQYRPLSKNRAGDPGSTTGPRHGTIRSDALQRGKWEMGGDRAGQIQTTDTIGNLGAWDTHITTEKSLSLGGRYIESFGTNVNGAALREDAAIYQEMFAGTTTYNATNHNSNFAVNSLVYGSGGDVPEGVFAPGFPNDPS
ncbi:MAG: RHS repeat-associated core domain-containing protein, partial [Elusimicrobia bacterium]|nr:RHS repeat-associated core domain-containing protein [Elusimicrobiota bacterium]